MASPRGRKEVWVAGRVVITSGCLRGILKMGSCEMVGFLLAAPLCKHKPKGNPPFLETPTPGRALLILHALWEPSKWVTPSPVIDDRAAKLE